MGLNAATWVSDEVFKRIVVSGRFKCEVIHCRAQVTWRYCFAEYQVSCSVRGYAKMELISDAMANQEKDIEEFQTLTLCGGCWDW